MIRQAIICGFVGALCAVAAPRGYEVVHAWLYPTPEQVQAAQKAHEERVAQQAAAMQADAQRRKDEVDSHLSDHLGCRFEDLGGYTTGDGRRYPVLAIFCPAERVTLNTSVGEDITHVNGKTTTHEHVEHPTSVTTDPTGKEQQQ